MDGSRFDELLGRVERLERRRRQWQWATAVLVAVMLATVPVAVIASHQFSDVPTSDPYHADIAAVAGHGIVTGCTATTFCPNATLTREQAAAMFHRGLGRAADFGAFGLGITGEVRQLDGAELRVPGAGIVLVIGTVTAATSATSGCPCIVEMQLAMGGTLAQAPHAGTVGNASEVGEAPANISASQLFHASSKGTVRPTMLIRRASGTAVIVGTAEIQAVWIPFNWQGQ